MDEVKQVFFRLWDKAAFQCKLLKEEIEKRYPYLTVMPGHGALDAEEHDSQDKESGAPDLYIYYGQGLVCAVEVTGSDKIAFPSKIWIGAHKASFASKATYPIGFFFFYAKDNSVRYFTSYTEIKEVLEEPKTRNIRGLNFEYHILDNSYFQGEARFWDWLDCCIEILCDSF